MAVKQRWTPNLKAVEIEICTVCNLRCNNCDRSAPQAPSGELMSVQQIEKFVTESVMTDWRWEHITVLGGEPTLHPELMAIIDTLYLYHIHRPETTFRILSNGYGRKTKAILSSLPPWLEVTDTHKDSERPPLFSPYNVAPIDLPEFRNVDFSTACSITELSGLGLSRYGFYPCGPGASIDRVFGLDVGIKSLREVDLPRLEAQLERLCSLCGHFVYFDLVSYDAKVANNEGRFPDFSSPAKHDELMHEVSSLWTSNAVMSTSWQSAYRHYRSRQPALSMY